jgi:hypothetical protein
MAQTMMKARTARPIEMCSTRRMRPRIMLRSLTLTSPARVCRGFLRRVIGRGRIRTGARHQFGVGWFIAHAGPTPAPSRLFPARSSGHSAIGLRRKGTVRLRRDDDIICP